MAETVEVHFVPRHIPTSMISEDDPLMAYSKLLQSEFENPDTELERARNRSFLKGLLSYKDQVMAGNTYETTETNHGGFLVSYEFAGKTNKGDTTISSLPRVTGTDLRGTYEGLRATQSGGPIGGAERTSRVTDQIRQRKWVHYVESSGEGKHVSSRHSDWASILVDHRVPDHITDGTCSYFCAGSAPGQPYSQSAATRELCRPRKTSASLMNLESEATSKYPPGRTREAYELRREGQLLDTWFHHCGPGRSPGGGVKSPDRSPGGEVKTDYFS